MNLKGDSTSNILPAAIDDTLPRKNLYEIIIDDILMKIDQNDFSFEKPICTEKQLTDEYKVSRITAKRAITDLEHRGILYRKRGVGSFVSRDIYSNLSSSNVQSDASKVFAFVLPFDITKGGLLDTVQTVNSILSSAGCYIGIYITDLNSSKEKTVIKQLLHQNISGIVLYPMTNNIHLELLNSFIIKDKPVIIIDKSNDCQYIHGVVSDNFNGGKMMTEYLSSLGHQNIAYLSRYGTADISTIRDRFGGYITGLKKAGLTSNPDNIITNLSGIDEKCIINGTSNPALNSVVKKLFVNGVTAIEAENDEVAYGIILACKELNIAVPEDMSVCGFDNSTWSQRTPLGITTISQDFVKIGTLVGEILLNNLSNKSLDIQKYTIPTQLILRESTAAPRQARSN